MWRWTTDLAGRKSAGGEKHSKQPNVCVSVIRRTARGSKMYRGMLIDPHEACECPQCGVRKAVGVELCTPCSQWCPDQTHRPRQQQKNCADELCGLCGAFLRKNESHDRKRQTSVGFWVYALWTSEGPYYGHSYDPWVRYDSHRRRLVRSTSSQAHAPAVKFGPYPTRCQAYRVERAITAVLARNGTWPYLPADPDGLILPNTRWQRWNASVVTPIG